MEHGAGTGVESEPDFAFFLLEPECEYARKFRSRSGAGVQFFSGHLNWKLTDCAVCTTELQTFNFSD